MLRISEVTVLIYTANHFSYLEHYNLRHFYVTFKFGSNDYCYYKQIKHIFALNGRFNIISTATTGRCP